MLAMAITLAGRQPSGSIGDPEREVEGDIGGVDGTISLRTSALWQCQSIILAMQGEAYRMWPCLPATQANFESASIVIQLTPNSALAILESRNRPSSNRQISPFSVQTKALSSDIPTTQVMC